MGGERVPTREEARADAERQRMERAGLDVQGRRDAAQAMLDAQGRGRAAEFLQRSPRCAVCHQPMVTRSNGDRHFLCDDRSIVGRSCNCPVGCSDRIIGDSPTVRCDPDCHPCRVQRGQHTINRRDRT